MATVIDALMVTLGLDARGFHRGQQQVKQSVQQTRGAAGQMGKDFTLATKQMQEGFQRVRNEILGLYALITAGRGLKQLAGDILSGDAAMGRLANNVNMSIENMSAWDKVVQRSGGQAGEFGQTISSLSSQMQQLHLTGTSSIVPFFLRMGVALSDVNTGKLRDLNDILIDASRWAEQHPEMSQPGKLAILQGAGIGGGTAQAVLQGETAVRRMLAEQQRLGTPTQDDAKRAQELKSQLVELQTAFEQLMRRVIAVVSPTILKVMQSLTVALQDNMPKISAAIEGFAQRVAAFDWSGLITQASNFATEADKVATALGGWVRITETLFALWAAGRVLALVRGITSVGLGIAGVAVGGGASRAATLGGMGRLGIGAAATGATALSLLALLGFDPRKLLPRTLQDAWGTGHPDEAKPDETKPDRPEERPHWTSPADYGSGLPTNEPGKVTDPWYHKLERMFGYGQSPIAAQQEDDGRERSNQRRGDTRGTGFTPAQKEDLFLRFQQFLEEQERARKAVESARMIVAETARGDIARTGQSMIGGTTPGGALETPANTNVRAAPSEAARKAYDFWISKGYTPSGAAGMVARMMLESRGDPTARGDRVNGQPTAFGLFQHHMDRVTNMRNATGIDVRTASFEQQLEAKYQEGLLGLDAGAGRAYAQVRNSNDPAVAGGTVSLQDIRPGLTSAAKLAEAARTAALARQYQQMYAGNAANSNVPANVPRVEPFTPGALRVSNISNAPVANSTAVTTGNITINTQATDAAGISRDFERELQRRAFSNQANVGLR